MLINLASLQHEHILYPWLRILKVFQSRGCEVFVNAGPFVKKLEPIEDVYSFRWLSPEEDKLLQKDRTTTKISFMLHSLWRNLAVLKKSRNILAQNNFDVIYTPLSVLDFAVYPYFLKLTGKKIKWATTLANIVTLTDEGSKIIRFLAWLFFKISLRMIRRADVIFASTPEIREYLIKKGFQEDKVILTGFAIENEMIEKAKANMKYDIDALFVGRINETKGIYDMVEVLKIAKKKYPVFQLAIMGEGDEITKNNFQRKIKEMGLENNAQFLGYKDGMEKYNIMKSARSFWFLSKSKSESFGVALLEAVCSGIPAFSYDLPQFRWLYPNGEVNISPRGDYESVARKVLELFESRNFRNEKGEKLLGKYSWEKIAETEYGEIKKILG